MSIIETVQYRIEHWSNDDECWFDDESARGFRRLDTAIQHFKVAAEENPDMPHRLIKIETVALSVRGETLTTKPVEGR